MFKAHRLAYHSTPGSRVRKKKEEEDLGGWGRALPLHRVRVHHPHTPLSHRMYLLIGFRKSTSPQNRRLIVYD